MIKYVYMNLECCSRFSDIILPDTKPVYVTKTRMVLYVYITRMLLLC